MTLSVFEYRVSEAILKHPVIADKSQKNVEDRDEKVIKAFEQVQQFLKEEYNYQIPIAGLVSMWDRIVKRVKDVSLKEKKHKLTKDDLIDDEADSDVDIGKSEEDWEDHFKKYGCMDNDDHISPRVNKQTQKTRTTSFKTPAPKRRRNIENQVKHIENPTKSTPSTQPSCSNGKKSKSDSNQDRSSYDPDNTEEVASVGGSQNRKRSPELSITDSGNMSEELKNSVDNAELVDFMQIMQGIESPKNQKSPRDLQVPVPRTSNSKEIYKMIDNLTGHRPCKSTGLKSKTKHVVKFPKLDTFAQRNKQTIEQMDKKYKSLESTLVENSKNLFNNENKSVYYPLIFEKFSNVKSDNLDACMNEVLKEINESIDNA